MDRRERFEDIMEAMRVGQDGHQARIWTAMPGIIQSFNAQHNTVVVQPAIKGRQRKPDGSETDVTMPQMQDVPVHFPSAGGYALTFPIKKGDECLLVYASRCIDNWWDKGGVQTQAELRMHDLSDGFAIIGTRSKPNALKDVSGNAVQLRSEDGKTKIEISGGNVNITTTGNTTINAGGRVVLNNGSQRVARVGDTVQCPAGIGHIIQGANKVLS